MKKGLLLSLSFMFFYEANGLDSLHYCLLTISSVRSMLLNAECQVLSINVSLTVLLKSIQLFKNVDETPMENCFH